MLKEQVPTEEMRAKIDELYKKYPKVLVYDDIPSLMCSSTLEMVRHHNNEDITLGPGDCTAHGRATVARAEAKLLISCGISGGRILAQNDHDDA